MTVAQDKTSLGSGSAEWQTPPELFAQLNRRYAFDYDAFASHENALCGRYSTIEGTYECGHWDERDGLHYPWAGRRVFMNPPYSRDLIAKCVRKAVDESNNAAIIVALLPASTDTQWFQQLVFPYCHIDWLPKRVSFIHPPFECGSKCQVETKTKKPHRLGEPGEGPASGSVVAVFKADLQ